MSSVNPITGVNLGRDTTEKQLGVMQKKIKNAFSTIKEELNEHLDSINENTNESQAIHDYACELDSKISKLDEKIDHLQMMFEAFMEQNKNIGDIELSIDEQKVFLVLYTAGDSLLSHKHIAEKIRIPKMNVSRCILSMSDKGIPVSEKSIDGDAYFELEKSFRDLQAKEGVVKISPSIRV